MIEHNMITIALPMVGIEIQGIAWRSVLALSRLKILLAE